MDQTLGMIFPWTLDFAPPGYMFCQGQLLTIQNYPALFNLLGITYGGDGKINFALPNLCGRVILGAGNYNNTIHPETATYKLGQIGGSETVALTPANIPPHVHQAIITQPGNNYISGYGTVNVSAVSAANGSAVPSTTNPAIAAGYSSAIDGNSGGHVNIFNFAPTASNMTELPAAISASVVNPNTTIGLASAGGGQPHPNIQPSLVLNFIIATQGNYPERP